MASSCPSCKYKPSGVMEKIANKTYIDTMNKLKGLRFEVDLGAGCKDTFTFDEANDRYMSRYFPDSDQKVYCCPPVYEYKHPGEPLNIIKDAKSDDNVPFLRFSYDTLKEERKGEIPEEETFQMFFTMFHKHNIPSFVIHNYNWKTVYMKKLIDLYPRVFKSFKKLELEEGELDVLISIPRKCLIIVEVKAIDPSNKAHLGNVVNKAFIQCGKTATFLSTICSDIYGDKNIPLIKVVALPNCGTSTIEGLNYCHACTSHIIPSEDMKSADALYDWFVNVTGQLHQDGPFELDHTLQESLIGRLIGPASLLEVRTNSESILRTVHQIEGEHGTAEKIQMRFLQLNPEQLAVKFRSPQFLWMKGEPATGKTVLAYMKIYEILEESGRTAARYESEKRERLPTLVTSSLKNITMSQQAQLTISPAVDDTENPMPSSSAPTPETTVNSPLQKMGTISPSGAENVTTGDYMKSNFQSVIYVFTGLTSTGLTQIFKDKFNGKQNSNCQIIVTSFDEFKKLPGLTELYGLPNLIKVLQEANKGKIVHIIFDECPYLLKGFNPDDFKKEWNTFFDKTRLGYVWCIQHTYYTEKDSGDVPPFEFVMVHLTYIMRLSRQNIEIANKLLEDKNLNFKSGHAVAGRRPVMYRLKCVCKVPKDSFECMECHNIRIILLLQHVLDEFKICRGVVSEGELALRDVALLCEDGVFAKMIGTYLEDTSLKIPFAVNKCTASTTNCMTVCSVEFYRGCEQRVVLVDFAAVMGYYTLKEALTRSLGQLVMLDCGQVSGTPSVYEKQIKNVISARDMGKMEINEIKRSAKDVEEMNLYNKDSMTTLF